VDINTINNIYYCLLFRCCCYCCFKCTRITCTLYEKKQYECNKMESYEGVLRMDGHSHAIRDLTRSRGEYGNIYTEHNGRLWLNRLVYVVMCLSHWLMFC